GAEMLGGRSLYGGGGRFAVPGPQRGPTVPPQSPVLHSRRPALAGQDRSGNAERHPPAADAAPSRPLRKDTALRDTRTTLIGNATADPTAHPQEDGSVTAKVRVAVTGRYYNTTSQDFADRKTEFITVFVRRQLAQNVLRSVRKGQPLIATGR